MKVALIAKPGHRETGVGRYAAELERSFRALGLEVSVVTPWIPVPPWLIQAIRRRAGFDLAAFLNHYPVWARYPRADIYHLTSQNLATLLLFHPPPGQTVVTVHDIIPWLVRRNPELNVYRHWLHRLFDHLALLGLKRANGLVADSDFTARSIVMAFDSRGGAEIGTT